MDILIIIPEFLPVPSIKGGAIETLLNDFIEHNERTKIFNITVYSPYCNEIKSIDFKKYRKTCFRYIDKNTYKYKIIKYIKAIKRRIFKKEVIETAYYCKIIEDLKRKNELKKYKIVILENGMKGTKLFKKNLNCKIILHLHNDKINKEYPDSRKVLENVDEVWAVSGFIKKRVQEILNIPTKVLFNGVDLKKFSCKIDKQKIKEFKKKYNIPDNKFIVLYSGRIMEEKGILELIKGFNKLSNDNILLLIAGKYDGANIKDFRKKVESEINNNKKNIMMLGNIEYDKMPLLYKIVNMQVVPSIVNEAFGMIIIEGMSQKLPIVATNVGGIPELISAECGILIDKNSIENEIAPMIKKIYLDKEYAKKIGENGFVNAKQYSKEKYCNLFDKYIKESIEE